MENRSVRNEIAWQSARVETSTDETARELSLSEAELHSLIEFFQILDQWDRELVQNVGGRSEVNVCTVQ